MIERGCKTFYCMLESHILTMGNGDFATYENKAKELEA